MLLLAVIVTLAVAQCWCNGRDSTDGNTGSTGGGVGSSGHH